MSLIKYARVVGDPFVNVTSLAMELNSPENEADTPGGNDNIRVFVGMGFNVLNDEIE